VPDRPQVFEVGIWGPEATLGVQVPSTKRLLCTEFLPSPVIPRVPYRPQGFVAPTTVVSQKENVTAPLTGAQCYGDLAYLYASLLKTESISTPSGATNARRFTYSPSAVAPDTFRSYTLEKGTLAGGAERITGCVVESLTQRWTKTDANLTGNIMGQVSQQQITPTLSPTDIPARPINPNDTDVYIGSASTGNNVQTMTLSVTGGAATGGTFTITVDGQTTAPIAFNAPATGGSSVTTALNLLSKVGNNVTVSGGPGPSTPYVFTFSGILAGLNVTLLKGDATLLTGPGAPYANPAVVNTTPGAMTKLLRCDSIEFAVPTRYAFPFTLNVADPSYSYVVQIGMEPTCTIVLEHDSVSAGFMTQLRAGTVYYATILSRGPFIEALIPHSLQLRFPFFFTDAPRSDVNGVAGATWRLNVCYDPTFAGFLTAVVDNTLLAL
jgi:hypothetical protein